MVALAPEHPRTMGADKGYDTKWFVAFMGVMASHLMVFRPSIAREDRPLTNAPPIRANDNLSMPEVGLGRCLIYDNATME